MIIVTKLRQVQADKWNAAGTPTDDGNIFGTQIGKGVYTTAKPNGWPGGTGDWLVAP